IVMLIALSNVSAKSYGQSVVLRMKNASIKEVLQVIENQTGYHFLYDNKDISKAGLINVNIANVPLEEALEACFKDQPLTYKIFKNTIVLKEKIPIERATISLQSVIRGQVTDGDGSPLAGVSIKIQGTSAGAVTDEAGRYSINTVDEDGMLVFTYVGFVTQEVRVAGRTSIDVQLSPSSEALSEIVVIGYGTQRRSDLTGAITSVSSQAIEGQAFSNVN